MNTLWNEKLKETWRLIMGNKLKDYILSLRTVIESDQPVKDSEALRRELLTEIGFCQHERLIHLLVTILFALLTMAVFILILFYATWGVLLLLAAMLCLLVPYIRHYFILENGVQTLYVLYEQLLQKEGFPPEYIPSSPGVRMKPLSAVSKAPKKHSA